MNGPYQKNVSRRYFSCVIVIMIEILMHLLGMLVAQLLKYTQISMFMSPLWNMPSFFTFCMGFMASILLGCFTIIVYNIVIGCLVLFFGYKKEIIL